LIALRLSISGQSLPANRGFFQKKTFIDNHCCPDKVKETLTHPVPPLREIPQVTKITVNQINNLVFFGDLVHWCLKKESKVLDVNNGFNPVLSIISKHPDYFPRTLMIDYLK